LHQSLQTGYIVTPTVVSDEGHGVILVKQLDSAGDLIGWEAQFLGDGGYDWLVGHGSS